MSKLPETHRFIDLSDYGRPIAIVIAKNLKSTSVTPVHVTLWFIVAGLLAVLCMIYGYYWYACALLKTKSILDAADGELARVKNIPSYTGRYLDSIADLLLNLLIFLALWRISDSYLINALLAFGAVQLQGTLYNYYYVILRNRFNGDKTSRVAESQVPIAMPGETQKTVTILYHIYNILYIIFDKTIYWLDPMASNGKIFPNWFMTMLSTMGLGFQLLLIGVMLALGWKEYIVTFFLAYSILIFVFILIRRVFF